MPESRAVYWVFVQKKNDEKDKPLPHLFLSFVHDATTTLEIAPPSLPWWYKDELRFENWTKQKTFYSEKHTHKHRKQEINKQKHNKNGGKSDSEKRWKIKHGR